MQEMEVNLMQTLYHQCGPSNNLRNNSIIFVFMFFLYLFICEFDANLHSAEWSTSNVITHVSLLSAEFALLDHYLSLVYLCIHLLIGLQTQQFIFKKSHQIRI